MNTLPVQRFQFEVKLNKPLQLDFYSGSMLRGVFGHAFKHMVCVTKMADCSACMLSKTCLYTQFFDTQPLIHELQKFSQIPKPFVIEPPPLGESQYATGDSLQFSMVLFGQFMAHIALVILTWEKVFTLGIGKEYTTGCLQTVSFVAADDYLTTVYNQGTFIENYTPKTPTLRNLPTLTTVDIVFETPLCIKKNGKPLQEGINSRDFLMALIRRYYLLVEFYGIDYQKPDFANFAEQIKLIECTSATKPCNLQRYSNRQKQKMTFDGVLGQLKLWGELRPLMLEILYLGQWIHVGNKTTFGMGKYKYEVAQVSPNLTPH